MVSLQEVVEMDNPGIDTPEVQLEDTIEEEERSRQQHTEENEEGEVITETTAVVVKKTRKSRKKLKDNAETVTDMDLSAPKKSRKKKEPERLKSPKEIFRETLAKINIQDYIEPWMHTKAFKLIESVEQLEGWVSEVMTDQSRWREGGDGELMPIIAVDTETDGLDTRLVNGMPQINTAGICLSSSGVDGLYVPLCHESTANVPIREVQRVLQGLFDVSHLVYFNGKYDREVLRNTLGITLRGWPYFEDVQILEYLVDPKSDAAKTYDGTGGNTLKDLSLRKLGYKQIRLGDLTKIRCKRWSNKAQKMTLQVVMVPFYWLPGEVALWYAAGDAICTWLLWDALHEEARKIKGPHKIDHKLLDALCWMERQRYYVDVPALQHLSKWHGQQVAELKEKLCDIAGLGPDFNPGSTAQLSALLFDKWGFQPVKVSAKTGKPSTDEESLKSLRDQELGNEYAGVAHEFLETLLGLREYAALHPENLSSDPRDHSARVFFRQTTVAGGRLAASGGESYDTDGGFGLNIQAIKSVGGNQWVMGRRLRLEEVEDQLQARYGSPKFSENDVSHLAEEHMHPSCLKGGVSQVEHSIHNRLVKSFGEWYSLSTVDDIVVLGGEGEPIEIPLDPWRKIDINQVVNLRSLFIARPGWMFYTADYSNIEMRVAANISKEVKFIREFNEGTGDFHSLTAGIVFPEFDKLDPKKDAARRKKLRSLAKIINFALLYGGTGYTLRTNMIKELPDVTLAETEEMARKYWEGVPTFYEWAENKRAVARDKMWVRTATGRIVKFQSAMESYGLHKPTDEESKNLQTYYSLIRLADQCKDNGDTDDAEKYGERAFRLFRDPDSGVKNAMEYKKFLNKVERVSLNVPLQGLAGDLMRMSLNAVYEWACKEPALCQVFILHGSVHDELDFCVKNEFAPYVVPRLMRIMKLRHIHEQAKWPVPIETDCEYGTSWDVKEHLTGDDGHVPAGWTKVPGLEEYVPAEFDAAIPDKVERVCKSGKENTIKTLISYLKDITHERVHFIWSDIQKIGISHDDQAALDDVKRRAIAALQLHEYWTIDADESKDQETLAEYAERMGLTLEPVQISPLDADPNIVESLPPLMNEWLERKEGAEQLPTETATPDISENPSADEVEMEMETHEVQPKVENISNIPIVPDEEEPNTSQEEISPVVAELPPPVQEEAAMDTTQAEAEPIAQPEPVQEEDNTPQVVSSVLEPPNNTLVYKRKHSAYRKYQELHPWVHETQVRELASLLTIGPCTFRFIYRGTLMEIRNVSIDKLPDNLVFQPEKDCPQ